MDKLQPILAHRFWIALGLTILLALGAWYTGTGALAEQIETNEARIKATTVPEAATAPNQTWIDDAAVVRGRRDAELKVAARTLADTQQDLRDWPESYRPYVKDLEYFEPFERLGPEGRRSREQYRFVYEPQIEALRDSLNPYDFETQTGAISVPEGVLPRFDTSEWQKNPPLSMTVWSAQEDIWLMRELLRQVVKVNGDSTSILKSPLKEIQEFRLRGGAGLTPVDPNAAPLDPMAAGGDAEEGGSLLRPTQPTGRRGGDSYADALVVDLDEELGPEDGLDLDPTLIAPELAAAAAAAADPAAGGGGGGEDEGGTFGNFGARGGGGGSKEFVSPGGGRRYIASDPALPYRTRAFRLQLAIDHRRLATVLADLSNCVWPVEIVRVHYMEGVTPIGPRAAASARTGGMRPGGMREDGMREGGLTGRLGRGLGRPNPGLGGGGFRNPRGGADNRPQLDPSDPYQVAMSDPYLATVVIGGVMTIYKPRPADEELEAAAGSPEDDGEPVDLENLADPLGAAPAAADAPADPAAPVELGTSEPGMGSPAGAVDPAAVDPAAVDPAAGVAPAEDPEEGGFGFDAGAGAGDDFDLNVTPPPVVDPGSATPEPAAPDAGPMEGPEIPEGAEPVAAGAG